MMTVIFVESSIVEMVAGMAVFLDKLLGYIVSEVFGFKKGV